jgi:D-alanine--poly(phosphoribitol) ligase subunit 1
MTAAELIARIDARGRRQPARVAQVSGDQVLTYGELARRSDALAAELARSLPDDGSPVAVVGHKEPAMLIGFLAAVKAGHPYVPLDTSLPPARIARIVAGSGARVTLAGDRPPPALADEGDAAPAPASLTRGAPFYVMYTSGSTGEPKGVVITGASLAAFVAWIVDEHRLGEDEVILDQAPYSFDLSVMSVYPALAAGAALHSVRRQDVANPLALLAALGASGVTTWVSTPSFARMCLADARFAAPLLPRLRRLLFCGETLAPEVASALLDRFPAAEVWNTYGPTEATVATTSVRVDRELLARYPALPVGRAMPGVRIAVLDETRAPVADGEQGEITIAGPNVSAGYLGRPDLDASAFVQLDGVRAYCTGDLGRVRGDLLFFEGRRDSQVKLHGHRIELGDVEANLCALPGVRDAVVLKQDHPERLVAFVLVSEPSALTPQGLRVALAGRLPRSMVPARVEIVDRLPLTANHKVDRRALAARLA